MRKRIKPYSKHLRPVRLYLDDVEAIYRTLSEVAEEVKIQTDEYILDEPKQLSEIKRNHLTNLEIVSSRPFISLTLEPDSCWLYVASDEPTSRGVFEEIKELAESRKARFWFAYTLPFIALLGLGTGICLSNLISLMIGFTEMSQLGVALNVVGALLTISWSLFAFHTSFNKHSIVFLTHRPNVQTFLVRNRDNIVLALISAIFGATLGGLVTFFVSKFI